MLGRLAISWREPRAHYPALTVLPERAAMVAARMCAPALVGLGVGSMLPLANYLSLAAWWGALLHALRTSSPETEFLVNEMRTHASRLAAMAVLEAPLFYLIFAREHHLASVLTSVFLALLWHLLAERPLQNPFLALFALSLPTYWFSVRWVEFALLGPLGLLYLTGFFVPESAVQGVLFAVYAAEGALLFLLV